MENKMTEELCEKLLMELEVAYNKSNVKKTYEKNEWYYSLSSTPLYKNSILLIGFNWGAKKTCKCYSKQTECEKINFIDQESGSFKRVIKYLRNFFSEEDIKKIVQTNYCFFRSEKKNQITDYDLMLCQDIFIELLKTIKPKKILSFSNLPYKDNKLKFKKAEGIPIKPNKRVGNVSYNYGELEFDNNISIPFCFLPHPNYPVVNSEREKCWKFIMSNLNNKQ